MKFGNLLSKVLPSKKVGNGSKQSGQARAQLVYFIQFSNLEDNPIFELSSSLSIGSEVGEVKFNEPSLSPKHCTIFLNQDVISVVDHASETGTFVSEKKIPPGKMVILKDDDFIRAGDLEIDIVVQEKANDEFQDLSPSKNSVDSANANISKAATVDKTGEMDLADDLSLEAPALDDLIELSEDAPPAPTMTLDKTGEIKVPIDSSDNKTLDFDENDLKAAVLPKESFFKRIFKRKPKEEKVKKEEVANKRPKENKMEVEGKKVGFFAKLFKKKAKEGKKEKIEVVSKGKKAPIAPIIPVDEKTSANAVSRFLAFSGDCVLTFTALEILSPFKEVQTYIGQTTNLIKENYQTYAKPHVDAELKTYIDQVPAFVWEAIETILPYIGYLYLFIAMRILSNLLFGRSLGQLILGISATGNFIWVRLGGIIREIFSVILFPFSIFDFVTLFGLRPFQEAVTFTRLEVKSKLAFALGTFLGFPLILILFLISPFLIGFEFSAGHKVVESKAVEKTEMKNLEARVSNTFKFKFNLRAIYYSNIVSTLNYSKKNGLEEIKPGLIFSYGDNGILKLVKRSNFDLSQILQNHYRYDLLFEVKYPEMYRELTNIASSSTNFKKNKLTEDEKNKIQLELNNFIKTSLSIDLLNIHEYIQTTGPIFKTYLEVRRKIIQDLELQPGTEIELKKIGDITFLTATELIPGAKPRTKISYVPIVWMPTITFDITVDEQFVKNKKVQDFESKVIGTLEIIESPIEKVNAQDKTTITSVELFDFLLDQKDSEQIRVSLNQLFQQYYYLINQLMTQGRSAQIEWVKGEVKQLIEILTIMPKNADFSDQEHKESIEAVFNQSIKKFSELSNALEQNNIEFFGAKIGV